MYVLASILNGFANLLNFRGRDTPKQFWPYALLVVAALTIAQLVVADPAFEAAMRNMVSYAHAHPDQGNLQYSTGGTTVTVQGFHPEFFAPFASVVWPLLGTVLLFCVLLAAAVIRRLGDAGRSFVWAALPLLFFALGVLLFWHLLTGTAFSGGLFGLLFANNVAYLVSLIVLIVNLTRPSRA